VGWLTPPTAAPHLSWFCFCLPGFLCCAPPRHCTDGPRKDAVKYAGTTHTVWTNAANGYRTRRQKPCHAHAGLGGLFFHPLRFNSSITPKSRQALLVHFNKHHTNEQAKKGIRIRLFDAMDCQSATVWKRKIPLFPSVKCVFQ
jgi:hypothetical protein